MLVDLVHENTEVVKNKQMKTEQKNKEYKKVIEIILEREQKEYSNLDQISSSDNYGRLLYDVIQQLKGQLITLDFVLS